MFKCRLALALCALFLYACTSKKTQDVVLIDVQKTCSENTKLTEKIMHFNKGHFETNVHTEFSMGREEIWDLKKYIARQYNLEWFQLKFIGGKLQSVWFGPRTNFESDMESLAINLYFIKGPKGEKINTYNSGTYTLKDLAGRTIRIEHAGAPVKGTMVTCYDLK